jgi:hypothetical protein
VGQIAGFGMLIAFITIMTVLPAALVLLRPPAEPHQMGFATLAPIDRFTMQHRIPIVVLTVAAVACASPLLLHLDFDFNPLHLQNPKVESMATYLELRRDPTTGANAINVLAPALVEANKIATRLARLREVSRAMTIDGFIPEAQDQKLEFIEKAAVALNSAVQPAQMRAAPTGADTIRALQSAATDLSQIAGDDKGSGAMAARRLSSLLSRLAAAPSAVRAEAEEAFAEPLRFELGELHLMLKPERVTARTLPADLTRDWIAPNGNARVEVLPKGNPNDDTTLRNFASALAVEPNATGAPVALQEAAGIVVRAFIEAGALALASIAILLWLTLRRVGDVLLTLVPLVLAGVVTLEICVLIGLPLNFANIIARFRSCSESASRSRSTTSWRGAGAKPISCSRH